MNNKKKYVMIYRNCLENKKKYKTKPQSFKITMDVKERSAEKCIKGINHKILLPCFFMFFFCLCVVFWLFVVRFICCANEYDLY